MTRDRLLVAVTAILLAGCAAASAQTGEPDAVGQVEAIERAFAQTMADRDHGAFTSFLSEEAVFLGGSSELRGKQQVADGWNARHSHSKNTIAVRAKQLHTYTP